MLVQHNVTVIILFSDEENYEAKKKWLEKYNTYKLLMPIDQKDDSGGIVAMMSPNSEQVFRAKFKGG